MEHLSKNQIKWVRSLQQKKQRDAEGVFVAEGHKCVEELRTAYELVLLVTPDNATELEIAQMSNLRTPQGVIGVFRKRHITSSPHHLITSSPILVCNVDILSNIDIPALLRAYNPEEMGLVVVMPRDTQRYLVFDDTQRLCGWTNIATGEVRGPISNPIANTRNLAFSGMQVLNPRIFSCMDELVALKGEKFSLIDLYVHIAEKEVLRAFIPENYRMMDVGKISQLSEAESFAASL
mgnify:CR=1 FL=1